jgi:hypothetical protein
VKRYIEAVAKAKQDTARFMTRQLRQHATDNGWDSEVVNNMHVTHENGKFSTHVHPAHVEKAMNLEYGTESQRPRAAVRKFLNDSKTSERAFMTRINHHLKENK